MAEPFWVKPLVKELNRLARELYALKCPKGVVKPLTPEDFRDAIGANDPPWSRARVDEREEFAERHHGKRLDELTRDAFDPMANLIAKGDKQHAIVQLVAWDLRSLGHPSVQSALRIAQVANDQEFLRSIAKAIPKNERYARRGVRRQRRLSRLLHAFAFGDPRAYQMSTGGYRDHVFEGLGRAFRRANVPTSEPEWAALNSRPYFNRHLTRLGF